MKMFQFDVCVNSGEFTVKMKIECNDFRIDKNDNKIAYADGKKIEAPEPILGYRVCFESGEHS